MFSHIIKSSQSIQDILPFIQLNSIDEHNDVHVIGLGSAGTFVAEHFFNQDSHPTYTSISCPPKRFIKHLDSIIYPNESSTDLFSIDINIEEVIGQYKQYVFIAGIGGKLGREFLQAFIDYMQDKNLPYTAIAIEPFNFEGQIARRQAQQFKNIYGQDEHVHFFSNNSVVSQCGGMLLDNTFSYANQEIYKLYQNIIHQNAVA